MIGDTGVNKHSGQVIGCDYSNAKSVSNNVDAFLFIGGGRFHAIGIALATAKPVIVADPFENRAYSVSQETQSVLKKRWANITEAKRAETFGVLIGLKSGQEHLEKALLIQEELQKYGKRTILLALREITPEILMQYSSIDAFVNTACPRVSLDDGARFRKPILTFEETLVLLGKRDWEELCKKGWFEN
jgi:2-(3-amino-3-carboxypropyl)histidine synthase